MRPVCNSPVHELTNEVSRLGGDLVLSEKIALLEIFLRDSRLTPGEELVKLTAGRLDCFHDDS